MDQRLSAKGKRCFRRFVFVVSAVAAWCSLSSPLNAAKAAGEAGLELAAGPEFHYFRYEEADFIMEDGLMFGAYGRATFRWTENERVESWRDLFNGKSLPNVLRGEVKATFGEIDYDSVSTGSIDGVDDYLIEARGIIGQDFPVFASSLITPYIGFGYRYWNDDLSGKTSTTGHLGFERESRYLYLPVGFETVTPLDNGWTLGINVEFDVFLDGQQESHLEDADASLSTLVNDQNEGFGLRGAVTLAKQTNAVTIVVEPFIRYWDVDDSKVGTISCGGIPCALGFEPRNHSIEAGARVGLLF